MYPNLPTNLIPCYLVQLFISYLLIIHQPPSTLTHTQVHLNSSLTLMVYQDIKKLIPVSSQLLLFLSSLE